MSLAIFARVWETSPASGNAFLVHLALADLAHGRLVQAPQADIALLARCSIPTVSRALQELVDAGAIEAINDRRTKTPIYRLIHRGDDISDQLRANRHHDLQSDSNYHDDVIGLAEGDQIDGVAMRKTVQPVLGFPAHIEPSNTGRPIPVVQELPSVVAVKALADLQDSATQAIREQTEAVDAMPAPDPEPSFKAPAKTIIKTAEDIPTLGLQSLLKALGIEQDPAAPIYWYRDEHILDYLKLLAVYGGTGADLAAAVRTAGLRAPSTTKTIESLYPLLVQAKIITF